mgnify:CR=1 FL=1
MSNQSRLILGKGLKMEKLLEIVAAEVDATAPAETGNALVPVKIDGFKPGTMIVHRDAAPLPSYAAITFVGDGNKRPDVTITEAEARKACLKALAAEYREMFAASRKK